MIFKTLLLPRSRASTAEEKKKRRITCRKPGKGGEKTRRNFFLLKTRLVLWIMVSNFQKITKNTDALSAQKESYSKYTQPWKGKQSFLFLNYLLFIRCREVRGDRDRHLQYYFTIHEVFSLQVAMGKRSLFTETYILSQVYYHPAPERWTILRMDFCCSYL